MPQNEQKNQFQPKYTRHLKQKKTRVQKLLQKDENCQTTKVHRLSIKLYYMIKMVKNALNRKITC